MKTIITLFLLLITINKTIAQGTITTYNNHCKTCHQEPTDLFKTNNKNINKTIYNMFKNQCQIKPTKKQLEEMNFMANTYKNNKILIQITKIDKSEIRGEATNYTTIQMIKNNKIIETRNVQTNFFSFPNIKGIKTLTIIKNNKKYTIPIKVGLHAA